MSYFVVITFDLSKAASSPHGTGVYTKITEELEYEDFYKHRRGKRPKAFVLPKNTYVAQFDKEDHEGATELTEEISNSLKRIFAKFEVDGTYFVFTGSKWAWKGGHF
jgi:hypothetical protein